MEKEIKKALDALKKKGITIKSLGNGQYLVKNEGQFGLLSDDDFIIAEDELIDFAYQYA